MDIVEGDTVIFDVNGEKQAFVTAKKTGYFAKHLSVTICALYVEVRSLSRMLASAGKCLLCCMHAAKSRWVSSTAHWGQSSGSRMVAYFRCLKIHLSS